MVIDGLGSEEQGGAVGGNRDGDSVMAGGAGGAEDADAGVVNDDGPVAGEDERTEEKESQRGTALDEDDAKH